MPAAKVVISEEPYFSAAAAAVLTGLKILTETVFSSFSKAKSIGNRYCRNIFSVCPIFSPFKKISAVVSTESNTNSTVPFSFENEAGRVNIFENVQS